MANSVAQSLASTITLNDGVVMPQFGLGVYLADDGQAEASVTTAINNGYRLIDTAAFYNNEKDVGKAVSKSNVSRDDLFIVTKVWIEGHGRDELKEAFDKSLKYLNMNYVDLYLIHSPYGKKLVETYKSMIDLQKAGLVRSVGVSNFSVHHLEGLKQEGLPAPSVNQIELHPWMRNNSVVDYCIKEGITVMGYSPMAKGQRFQEPEIKDLSERYKKSTAQMMIRWSVQNGYITIPKSVSEKRIIENAKVFDWEIKEEDIKLMNSFAEGTCTQWDPFSLPFTG